MTNILIWLERGCVADQPQHSNWRFIHIRAARPSADQIRFT